MACLDENLIAELAGGQLDGAQRERVLTHVDGCPDCRELVALMAPAAYALSQTQPALRASRRSPASRSLDRGGSTLRMPGPRPPDCPLLTQGEIVDHYRILRLVGRGGMGEVYRAHDTKLGRVVALKVMVSDRFGDPHARSRFEREARAMARLNHPSIVTVFAVGEHNRMPYVAMEYVDGRSLRDLLTTEGVELARAFRIARAIAEALAEAHRRGVVHRDLKPENVIVAAEERIRVLDFGLAALGGPIDPHGSADTIAEGGDLHSHAETGVAGTPHYMAPEQWLGVETTPATDVWALGVMLFEMVTQELPFDADNVVDLARAVTDSSGVPTHPSLPPPLSGLLSRCFARDVRDRPSTNELIAELRSLEHAPSDDHVVKEPSVPERPASQFEAASPPPEQAARGGAGKGFVALGLAAVVVIGALALTWSIARTARHADAEPVIASAPPTAVTPVSPPPSAVTEASEPEPPPAASSVRAASSSSPRVTTGSPSARRAATPPTSVPTSVVPDTPPPAAGF